MDAADAQQVEIWLDELGEASALLREEGQRLFSQPLTDRISVQRLRELARRVEPAAAAHASLRRVDSDVLLDGLARYRARHTGQGDGDAARRGEQGS